MSYPTPLIAHDIYVMEQFLKPERIKMIRDIWKEMLDYLESLLDRFMNDLPPRTIVIVVYQNSLILFGGSV